MAGPQPNSRWLPDVIRALQAAGGSAGLPRIYRWIKSNRQNLPDEWEAAIRATIYYHSSDAKAYKPGNPDVFCRRSHGVWGLRYSEIVLGKTDKDLFGQAVASMSKEDWESFSGKRDAWWKHVSDLVAQLKVKYRIS
jgi:hypothetical protein